MTARIRRLISDYEQVKKDFTGHKNIIVNPIGGEPFEKYQVIYYVNGIYLLPDGRIETLNKHEIEINLHADYPRYKPLCKILTPIWHPNFRDGQICIGDIWGAGESLSDIIINIGDMIQYKSWNSYSPLSADAAKWAIENKHLFPVGNIELNIIDHSATKEVVEIDLFEKDSQNIDINDLMDNNFTNDSKLSDNDFDITVEELAGIEFVPTAQKMQTLSTSGIKTGQKINLKTIAFKGLIWALVGAFIGFFLTEITNIGSDLTAAKFGGYDELVKYYEYSQKEDEAMDILVEEFEKWCKKEGEDPDDDDVFYKWLIGDEMSSKAEKNLDKYYEYSKKADQELSDVYYDEYDGDEDKLYDAFESIGRIGTAIWSAFIALFIGLLLGLGEGVYYGSKENTIKYALIGAGISLVIGYFSGYLAQYMYAELLSDDASLFASSFIRGLGWGIMGSGIGASIGIVKYEKKRLIFCTLGGLIGAFIGGFLFNYVTKIIPNVIVARGIAIIMMGSLIGVGVGLLEQMAKSAWLKVIRGEFEGKEYLVFSGTTSIGNNGKNTIVLFKDKLVGPHHCDIIQEGRKYILVDCGTPMGTVVNGQKITKQILHQGDAISIGNSVLIFNTK